MGMSEREHYINNLIELKHFCIISGLKPSDELVVSLDYAISSLKTDEAYQLMYEGEDIYTRDDMVAMLEDLLMEIKHTVTMEDASSNEDLFKRNNVIKVVQFRIDKLKGE
jgi:enolase